MPSVCLSGVCDSTEKGRAIFVFVYNPIKLMHLDSYLDGISRYRFTKSLHRQSELQRSSILRIEKITIPISRAGSGALSAVIHLVSALFTRVILQLPILRATTTLVLSCKS